MTSVANKPSAAFIAASWSAIALGSTTCLIGLFNAQMLPSEKGFYGMACALALFGAVAVQKNTRDLMLAGNEALPPLPPRD